MGDMFFKQVGIFDPKKQRLKITLIGAGSVGSFIGLNLAKLGFLDIEIIDFDKVEAHNIPNQFFRMKDIGKFKVEALGEIIKDFTDVDVTIRNEKIDANSKLEVDMDRLYILAVDTVDARKDIYSIIKGSPMYMIDGGTGGEEYSTQIYKMDSEIDQKKYEDYLSKKFKELPCGMQNVIYTILSIASETVNMVKRLDKQEPIPTSIRRDMQSARILASYPKVEENV